MGETTGIAWTDHTFNPWWGCEKVSPGCANCYAETFDHRLGFDHWSKGGERRFFGEKHWNEPRKWNAAAEKAGKRARVFCASMADVFEDRPDLILERSKLWALISETPWLDWQVLTKRPENIKKMLPMRSDWGPRGWPNVWLGTTTEDQQRADERIPLLLAVPAALHFLSVEPQIGPVRLTKWLVPSSYFGDGTPHPRPDWVIIGGESGVKARPFDVEWARILINECERHGIAYFVKQLGDRAEENGHRLTLETAMGKDKAEWPRDLRVQQFPKVRHV